MRVNEEKFYSVIARWLRKFIGCRYIGERKNLWGRQPDVIGIKFDIRDGLRAILYLIEVKVIDSLTSAYNLIGEIESRIASFKKKNSIFYALHPYLGIYEIYHIREIRDYIEHREVGLISLKNSMLSLERTPKPLLSNKVLTIEELRNDRWIQDEGEAKIFRELSKLIDWQLMKELGRNNQTMMSW